MAFISSFLHFLWRYKQQKTYFLNERQHRLYLLSTIPLFLFFALLSNSTTANDSKLDHYISEHLSEATELQCREPMLLPSSIIHACTFTSQEWPAGEETVEGPAWVHSITIAIPRKLNDIPDTALYFSDGGDNDRPGDYLKQFIMLARLKNNSTSSAERTFNPIAIMDLLIQHTNTVLVYQQQVPNQPYTFLDAPETELTEDKLIAESLVRAVSTKTTDADSNLLFPMAHANIAGLYRSIEFINTKISKTPIKHFIIGGASKRAWAMWLATAFDQGPDENARQLISGIVPVAMIQNFPETLKAIKNSYCHFPKPLSPFTERHIFQDLLSPYDDRYNQLFTEIDPYTYLKNKRFDNINALVIQPSSDNYFIPDAPHYYYPELKGNKRMMVIPNMGHGGSMPAMNYLYGALSNITALVHGQPLPLYLEEYDWHNNILSVHTEDKPEYVYVWIANNTGARDFRLDSVEFTRKEIQPIIEMGESRTYQWQADEAKGWTAFFMEMHYRAPGAKSFVLSTQVYITPDRYPVCR